VRHGRLAAGSSGSDADSGEGRARPIAILVLITIAWFTVVTTIICACHVAARADAADDDLRTRSPVGMPGYAHCDESFDDGAFHLAAGDR
jgi:hypothetical protein